MRNTASFNFIFQEDQGQYYQDPNQQYQGEYQQEYQQ